MSQHQLLRKAIQDRTGVLIETEKDYLFDTRLSELMKQRGITTFDELARAFEATGDQLLLDEIIDRITTHETRFFRDESIFDAFAMQMIPEWFEKRGLTPLQSSQARFDVWSSACSTGQEAYSLVIMVAEKWPALLGSMHVTATDISGPTLERARLGVFTNFEIERGMPAHLKERYFDKHPDGWQIKQHIRDRVKFSRHNLISDPFGGPFDVVFCRNVLIYFSDDQKRQVIAGLVRSLKQDGVLVLGSAESLSGLYTNYVLREYGLARYYEMNDSHVTIFKKPGAKS